MHLVDSDAKVESRLYRAEALEHYQRGRTDAAHLLEIEPAWTRWAYRVLLGLLFAALLFAALVHVDRYAEGVAIVRDGRLIAILPASDRARLRTALPLLFEHAAEPLTVTRVSESLIPASEARRLLGEDGPQLWTTSDPAIVIEARLRDRRLGDAITGRARVRLGSERLLFLWIPRGLRG